MTTLTNYIEFVNLRGEYNEIINWLIDNIEDCPRQTNTNTKFNGRPKPYHFSAISQFVKFTSNNELWKLEIRGTPVKKMASISKSVNPKLIVKFAILWT